MHSRSFKARLNRKKLEVDDIDMTSLLDIITILLVFLLTGYNATGIIITVPEGITLPQSSSVTPNDAGVIVQVSPNKIWVENQVVLDAAKSETLVYDHDGRRIVPLFNELVKRKELSKMVEKSTPQAKKFSGRINFVIDKTLKYNYLKKLMYTAGQAGYVEFKFAVLGGT